jgi:hypothetical protein
MKQTLLQEHQRTELERKSLVLLQSEFVTDYKKNNYLTFIPPQDKLNQHRKAVSTSTNGFF